MDLGRNGVVSSVQKPKLGVGIWASISTQVIDAE